MRIIDNWQYRYIEKCLYHYYELKNSTLDTECRIIQAIDAALNYFKGTGHLIMMRKFYFEAEEHRKTYTKAGHFTWVCEEILYTEQPNGYVIRREIIYRVAMNCYALKVFRLKEALNDKGNIISEDKRIL